MRDHPGSAVLVSGGAGYVGSHVVLALGEAGYRAVVVDDLSSGHREAVPEDVELVEADAGDRRAIVELILGYGIKAAIHVAGTGGVDESLRRAKRRGVTNAAFIAACTSAGVRRFVLTSSAAVYGAGAGPVSAYGAANLRAEELVGTAFDWPGLGYAVLRCFNAAGADPGLRAGPRRSGGGLVQVACEAALGLRDEVVVFGTDYGTADGTCLRDYVHPSDVAAAHVAALRVLDCRERSLTADCGTGRGHSVREVLAAVELVAGAALTVREGPRRRGDVAVAVASPERIGLLPGWQAPHGDLEAIV